MNFLKRLGVFFISLVVLSFLGFVVGGAYFGYRAGLTATDAAQGYDLGRTAGMAFAAQYGLLIWLGAFVVAATIAFRGAGLLFSAVVAVAFYFFFPGLAIRFPAAQPVATPAPALVTLGSQLRLKVPVTVAITYGSATIPAGTLVEVVEELQYNVRVRVPGGQTALVSRTNLE